jgi:ABC-type lipoprotein export system ATPase subunit
MAEVLLSIKGAEVRRGMSTVLSSFDFTLDKHQIVVLHGENGAGKSTLIETAARILPLEKGSVEHHGALVHHADGRRFNPIHSFGLTLQSNGVIGSETVQEHLQTVALFAGKELELHPLLDAYGLQHRANDAIANLSGGQARKVSVLAGLLPAMVASDPCLVLLDEPDAGLDDAALEVLMEHITSLAAFGHAFLIASHNAAVASIATHLHDLKTQTKATTNPASPWKTIGQITTKKPSPTRVGHRYVASTRSGTARNGITALLVLGCLLALGDPSNLPSGLWTTGAVLAPAFAAGLAGDPTTHLMQEARAGDWWRAQSQRVPAARGLGLAIGALFTALSSYVAVGTMDLGCVMIGALVCEFTMTGVRLLHSAIQRLARPNAVFIRLLLPAFILPWALIVSWASGL